MDSFVEQITAKRPDLRDTLKRIAIILAGSLTAAVFVILAIQFISMLIVFALGAFYLMYYLITGSYVEYEYIVTNNELDIDKISGKRKRKRLITVKINTAEQWDDYGNFDDSSEKVRSSISATVSAHNNTGYDMWYLIVTHEKHGKTLVIFSPDARIRAAINKAVPFSLRKSEPEKNDAETDDNIYTN